MLSQNLAIKLLRLFCLFLLGAISSIEHKLSNYNISDIQSSQFVFLFWLCKHGLCHVFVYLG